MKTLVSALTLAVALLAPSIASAVVDLSGIQGGLHYATPSDGPYSATWNMSYDPASRTLIWQATSNPSIMRISFGDGSPSIYRWMGFSSGSMSLAGYGSGVTVTVVADVYPIDGQTGGATNWWPYGDNYGSQQWTIGSFTVGGAPVGGSHPYKRISFTLTNNTGRTQSAYVFVQEVEGVAFLGPTITAGESATWTFDVLATDTRHYYAAFSDSALSQSTYGGVEVVTNRNDDGTTTQYWSGVLPNSGTETATQTAADGTGVASSGGYAGGTSGVNQVTGRTGGGPVRTTGTGDAATNAHLSSVGNSINQTTANVGGAVQQSVTNAGSRIEAAVNSGFTTANGHLGTLSTNDTARKTAEDNAKSAADAAVANMASQGNAAAGAGAAAVASAGVPDLGTNQPQQPSPGSVFTIQLGPLFSAVAGVSSIDLDPAHDDKVKHMLDFIRGFIAWGVVLMLAWWMWGENQKFIGQLFNFQQAHGNAVAAGTGAQATSLTAAALISVILLTALPAWFANTELKIAALGGVSQNPVAGATESHTAAAVYLLYLFLPVTTIMSAVTSAFWVRKFGLQTLVYVRLAILYVVP